MAMHSVPATPSVTGGLADEPSLICSRDNFKQTFHYWHGASGRRYLHTIYSLYMCPRMPKANYVVVRRNHDGSRVALKIGQTVDQADSLNLAYIRRVAAQLGANEIHIHVLADSQDERDAVECDLKVELLPSLFGNSDTSGQIAAL